MSVVLLPPPRRDSKCTDKTAGYFVSRTAVKPMSVTIVEDPLAAVLQRGGRAANPAEPMVASRRRHRIDTGVFHHSVAQCIAATGGPRPHTAVGADAIKMRRG